MKYDVFVICPVRNASEAQKEILQQYITKLKGKDLRVYYPATDTNQDDPIGLRICNDNKNAIKNSKEVHILFDGNSSGSLFDLGMAFAFNKPIKIINYEECLKNKTLIKSFNNVCLKWHDISK